MYSSSQSSSPRSLRELAYSRDESYKYSDSSRYSSPLTSQSSPHKVSEIMNPDGTVTIRDFHMDSDGSWTKNEQLINHQRRERLLRREYLTHAGGVNFDRQNRTQIMIDDAPGETDPSEAIAHQLRRQRLAQSSLLVDSSSTSTSGSPSPRRALHDGGKSAITLSPGPFRESRMMKTTMYSPTSSPTNTSTPSSRLKQGSRKSRNRQKHVVFSEPLTPPRSQPSEKLMERPVEEQTPSRKVINKENYGYFYHTEMSNPIMDIYSDLDSDERPKVSQSFSSGDSSVFDDVPQVTSPDTSFAEIDDAYLRRTPLAKHRNKISYADSDKEQQIPNLYSVTVTKASQSDRIGIYVHRESHAGGHRLVISKVAPDGKFADTKIKAGDVVVSINGEDMTSNPSLERALGIVTSAIGSVTIVVYESIDIYDSQSDVNSSHSESIAQTSISSISKDQSSFNSPKRKIKHEVFPGGETPDSFARGLQTEKSGTNAAGNRGAMTIDGSMFITKNSETTEPLSIKINESWKVSGVMVINIESEDSSELEDPGLRFGTKKTSSGFVTFISEISPTSIFKKTPLRIGDIIVSINRISFFNNADIFDAYAALWKSEKRITLVAKKGEESLNDFLLSQRGQGDAAQAKSLNGSVNTGLTLQSSGTLGTNASGESRQHSKTDGSKSFSSRLTDEHDTSRSSRSSKSRETPSENGNVSSASKNVDEDSNSSRRITITKKRHDEFIGLELSEVATAWGNLLTVSKITPGSKAASSELKVGDAILTVNGISFKNNPNASSAISLLRKSQKEVCIEFQKFSSFSAAVKADLKKSIDVSEDSEMLANSMISHGEGSIAKQKVPKKRQKVLVTVTKDHPGQKIGLDFALIHDKLVVTDVHPKGLLRNAPLMYGDTILSINGVNLEKEPVAKEAFDLVKNARKKVTLEILKVEYAQKKPDNLGVAKKSCIPGTLICSRRKKTESEENIAMRL